MSWWIKKAKKCPCQCHWGAVGQLNPQTVHCDNCKRAQLDDTRRRKLNKSLDVRKQLVDELDDVFSLIVRIKANWVCVKCGKRYEPHISEITGLPAQKLMTTSHYFSRKKFGTRWNFANCDAICIFCHQKIENEKKEWVEGFNYELFMLNKLGQHKFTLLEYRATARAGFSVGELDIMLKDLKRQLQPLLRSNFAT